MKIKDDLICRASIASVCLEKEGEQHQEIGAEDVGIAADGDTNGDADGGSCRPRPRAVPRWQIEEKNSHYVGKDRDVPMALWVRKN